MHLAHAGAVLTVHSDGAGSVWITAKWTDGHPVTGSASAILTASAAGQRVGPVPLRAIGDGAGTLTYSGKLPSGQWTVTAEMAMPAVARCDAQIQVPAAPSAVTCALPEEPAPGPAPAPMWPAVALGGGILAALLVVVLLLVARRR